MRQHVPVVVDVVRALYLADSKYVRVHSVSRESPIPNGLTSVAKKFIKEVSSCVLFIHNMKCKTFKTYAGQILNCC